jgi:hypothetical protein
LSLSQPHSVIFVRLQKASPTTRLLLPASCSPR